MAAHCLFQILTRFLKFLSICFHQYIGAADTVPPVYWCCAMQLHPLQRPNTENWKQKFPEKELRGLSPNFHIHVSVCLWLSVCLFCYREICGRSWEYMNRSQTHECGNRDWGRAILFLGIHKWEFSLQCPTYWWKTSSSTNRQGNANRQHQ